MACLLACAGFLFLMNAFGKALTALTGVVWIAVILPVCCQPNMAKMSKHFQ
jgi:hypothetical protein